MPISKDFGKLLFHLGIDLQSLRKHFYKTDHKQKNLETLSEIKHFNALIGLVAVRHL